MNNEKKKDMFDFMSKLPKDETSRTNKEESIIREETYEIPDGAIDMSGEFKKIVEDVHSKGNHLVEWTNDGVKLK